MKKIDSYYYIMPKINSGSIKDLNVKNQNLKKNRGKKQNIYDLGVGREFLDKIQKYKRERKRLINLST